MDRRSFLKAGGGALALAPLGLGRLSAMAPDQGPEAVPALPTEGKVATGPLKVRFLGTGAADWQGRDDRGELRRHSSILVDGRVLVDFTPGNADLLPEGFMPDAVFYTHSHGDHYSPAAAVKLRPRRVYVGGSWFERARRDFVQAASEAGVRPPQVFALDPGGSVVEAGIMFTALQANHATSDPGEQTMMYLLVKGTSRILYATDTAGIPASSARLCGIDAHSPGEGITGLVMEATMGMGHDMDTDYRIYTHSSVDTVARIAEVLRKTGRYHPGPGQPVYLTHLARTLHPSQAELDRDLPAPLRAAYDGLEVVFGSGAAPLEE